MAENTVIEGQASGMTIKSQAGSESERGYQTRAMRGATEGGAGRTGRVKEGESEGRISAKVLTLRRRGW
jgi:hypothetical protein